MPCLCFCLGIQLVFVILHICKDKYPPLPEDDSLRASLGTRAGAPSSSHPVACKLYGGACWDCSQQPQVFSSLQHLS